MLLSNSGNFIYLKTHKTGSTAAEFALIPYCAPPNHKEESTRKETLITHYGIVGARNSGDRTKKAKNNFFWHHMNASAVIDKIGEEKFFSFNRVACIRNPFRKLVSQFYFRYRYKNNLLKTPETLEETRFHFEDFLFTEKRRRVDPNSKKIDYHYKPRNDTNIVMCQGKIIITHFIRCEFLFSDLKDFCINSNLDTELLISNNLRDNTASKKFNHKDLFYTKELINRAIELEGWVFDAGKYSKDPSKA